MFETHLFGKIKVAEISDNIPLIKNIEDATDLMGNAYYQGHDALILRTEQLPKAFFDLSTRMAGEILQKFSNYRMRLFILGDFQDIPSQSLKDFIRESNQGNLVNFLKDLTEVQNTLEKK